MAPQKKHDFDLTSFRVDPRRLQPDHLVVVPVADSDSSDFRIRRVTHTRPPVSPDESYVVEFCSGTRRWEIEWSEADDSYDVLGYATRLPRPFFRKVLEFGLSDRDPTFGAESDRAKHALDLKYLRTDPRHLTAGNLVAHPTPERDDSNYRVRVVDRADVPTPEDGVYAVRFCNGTVATWQRETAASSDADIAGDAVRLMRPEVRGVLRSSLDGNWRGDANVSSSYSVLEHGCPHCGALHIPKEPCV